MKKTVVMLAAVASISGCAIVESVKLTNKASDKMVESRAVIKDQVGSAFAVREERQPLVKSMDSVYVSTKSVPVTSDSRLPPSYDRMVLRFPGRYTLAALAERISRETRIPVSIDEDLTLRRSASATVNVSVSQSAGGGQGSDPNSSQGAKDLKDVYRNTPLPQFSEEFELDYVGSLTDLLDLVAAKGRISWEYRKGVIYLSKNITRTFTLYAFPGQATSSRTVNAAVGGAGGGAQPAGSGSTSAQRQFNAFQDVVQTVQSLLSQTGKVTVNQATGSITVTDIKEVVDKVDRIMRFENETLNRQIRVRVDFLNVRYSNTAQAGLDLGYVAQELTKDRKLSDISFSGGGTLVGGEAGRAALRISGTNFTIDALVAALSNVGKTTVMSRSGVTTMNRQSAPLVVSNQTSYLAQTSPAAGGVPGAVGGVGLTPGVVTTGISLDILPIIQPNNDIMLQLAMDISELLRLNTVSSGSGNTQQSIQTPEISTMTFLQRLVMRNNETLVLVGFEKDLVRANNRDAVTGFSTDGAETREAFVIALTPVFD